MLLGNHLFLISTLLQNLNAVSDSGQEMVQSHFLKFSSQALCNLQSSL